MQASKACFKWEQVAAACFSCICPPSAKWVSKMACQGYGKTDRLQAWVQNPSCTNRDRHAMRAELVLLTLEYVSLWSLPSCNTLLTMRSRFVHRDKHGISYSFMLYISLGILLFMTVYMLGFVLSTFHILNSMKKKQNTLYSSLMVHCFAKCKWSQ